MLRRLPSSHRMKVSNDTFRAQTGTEGAVKATLSKKKTLSELRKAFVKHEEEEKASKDDR